MMYVARRSPPSRLRREETIVRQKGKVSGGVAGAGVSKAVRLTESPPACIAGPQDAANQETRSDLTIVAETSNGVVV
jgi:hypothetical protein